MSVAALPNRQNIRAARAHISLRLVILGMAAWLAAQHILLLAFLGIDITAIVLAAILALIVGALLARAIGGWAAADVAIPWRSVAVCLLVALILVALGGEGRFFYANTDWQVRDAVLRDLTLQPWPFVYEIGGAAGHESMLLRAPLGMYLLPALLGKILGFRAAELALWVQNALAVAAILSAGSLLFARTRDRIVGAVLIIGFSGMDIVGTILRGQRIDTHLEQWIGIQYSAHLTQLYWVPQHAVAGWIGALFYLLWRDGKLPAVALLTIAPLLVLLSPLALIGVLPFAAYAGAITLSRRQLRPVDIYLPALAVMVVLPSLLYLAAGDGRVGAGVFYLSAARYVVFLTVEIGLPVIALFRHGRAHHYGWGTSLLVVGSLLIIPFGQIGDAVDFIMRVSIPALAILSVLIAQMLVRRPHIERERVAVALAALAWIVGLATPASETLRALVFPVSPRPLCSYYGVVPGGAPTYVAPLNTVARPIRPSDPTLFVPHDPVKCWDGAWPAGQDVGLFKGGASEPKSHSARSEASARRD